MHYFSLSRVWYILVNTFEIYNGLHNLIVKYYEVIEKYSETFTKRIVEINLNRCFELMKHMRLSRKKNNKTSNKKKHNKQNITYHR